MSDYDHLRVEKREDTLIVHFLDRKIHAELVISTLGEELNAVAARPDCQKLILNFGGVEFFSSAVFGKLIMLNKFMGEKGGVLRLCEICDSLRILFKLTKLERILNVHDTLDEALSISP